MRVTPGYQIRTAGEEVVSAAANLARECYGQQAEPEAWWRWRYFDPDGGESAIVIAESDGQVVGMQPVTAARFLTPPGEIIGGILTGAMVAPALRRKGIFKALVQASVEWSWAKNAAFVMTMPNDRSHPAFMSFGWNDLGNRTLLAGTTVFGRRRSEPVGNGYRVVECRELSFEAGRMGLSGATDSPSIELGRSRAWLQWRYGRNPLASYRVAEGFDHSDSPVGLVVVTWRRYRGLKVGFVVDLLAGSPEAASILATAGVDMLRNQGSRIVVAVVSSPIAIRALRTAGLRPVPGVLAPKRFHTVSLSRPESVEAGGIPIDVSGWHLTLGDWDGI